MSLYQHASFAHHASGLGERFVEQAIWAHLGGLCAKWPITEIALTESCEDPQDMKNPCNESSKTAR